MLPAAIGHYAFGVAPSDKLAAVLLERIRHLTRAERIVLTRASVIGRRFRLAVLASTTTLGPDRVRAILDKACALQFIVRESSRCDWYAFRHALIRDVAYEELVATFVRPLHRLIARGIERCSSGDDSLEDLAYHSWAARDALRCLRYNELAGDQAAAVFAADDAQMYYSRAREFARCRSKHYRRLTSKLRALQCDKR